MKKFWQRYPAPDPEWSRNGFNSPYWRRRFIFMTLLIMVAFVAPMLVRPVRQGDGPKSVQRTADIVREEAEAAANDIDP